MVDTRNKSICDTDMLINLQLGEVLDGFLTKEKLIFIADSVKDELRFIFNPLKEYEHLYNNLFNNNENIKIIYSRNFSNAEQNMINATLKQYGIKTTIGSGNVEKNLGELVTSLYAVYKDIGIVRTCDKNFIEQYSNEYIFSEISFRNLNDTLSEFLSNKGRIQTNKLIEEQNKLFEISKTNSRKPKVVSKKPNIDDLIARFNNLKLS